LSPEVAAVVDRVVDSLAAEMRGLGLTLKLQSPVLSSLSPTPLLHEKHSGCPAACGGGNERSG
jgi:hypothetical protein